MVLAHADFRVLEPTTPLFDFLGIKRIRTVQDPYYNSITWQCILTFKNVGTPSAESTWAEEFKAFNPINGQLMTLTGGALKFPATGRDETFMIERAVTSPGDLQKLGWKEPFLYIISGHPALGTSGVIAEIDLTKIPQGVGITQTEGGVVFGFPSQGLLPSEWQFVKDETARLGGAGLGYSNGEMVIIIGFPTRALYSVILADTPNNATVRSRPVNAYELSLAFNARTYFFPGNDVISTNLANLLNLNPA